MESENVSFLTPKSSGCKPNLREWWVGEKLALITFKTIGLSSAFGNPKRMRKSACFINEASLDYVWPWWSCPKGRVLSISRKCVAHVYGNFWSVCVYRQTDQLREVSRKVTLLAEHTILLPGRHPHITVHVCVLHLKNIHNIVSSLQNLLGIPSLQ